MSTLLSCFRAVLIAFVKSSFFVTFETPKLDPAPFGFTKQGNLTRLIISSSTMLFPFLDKNEVAQLNPNSFSLLLHPNLLKVKAETLALQEV